MHWQLRRNSGSKELPLNVRTALATRFELDAEAINRWRFLEKSGKFAGRPVRSFQIIEPSLIAQGGTTSLKYGDLDNDTSRDAIQFEGYIEKEGYVILRDRRPKRALSGSISAD